MNLPYAFFQLMNYSSNGSNFMGLPEYNESGKRLNKNDRKKLKRNNQNNQTNQTNQTNQANICTCSQSNRLYLFCEEEYNKCPKTDKGISIHGHNKICSLCTTVVCHYHCENCHKQIMTNGKPMYDKQIYFQGKKCDFYL